MTSAPTLTDGTVTLRAHRPEDARGSYEQCQDPVSQAWTTVPVPYSMSDAETFVGEIMPKGWADGSEWGFAVEAGGRYAGTVSLRNEGDGRAEIAFGSHPWARGKGYVERALRLLVDWGFAEQDLHTIVWWANRGNWPSRKVAWRLGFSFDGIVRRWLPQRGELLDGWVGTLLRDDPREPRSTWLDCPVVEADGLRLRPWRPEDAARVVEACGDERTAYWLGRLPSPYTMADAEAYLQDRIEILASATGVGWAVVEPGTDLLLASVALFDLREGRDAEIGYWTHPDARGRGVMTRATAAVRDHAFDVLGLRKVRVCAAVDNAASRHVIEANGFRLVGTEREAVVVRDGLADHAFYEMLATERPAPRERTWTAADATTTRNPATDSATPTSAVDR
jgi:RimJ/RimL family protein N-acetyltransferase